jgi:hypothetical protein
MAGEAGDGTTKEVGSAQMLGKEGYHVTRVGQGRTREGHVKDTCQPNPILWGMYARQRARSSTIVYEILNINRIYCGTFHEWTFNT